MMSIFFIDDAVEYIDWYLSAKVALFIETANNIPFFPVSLHDELINYKHHYV